MKKKRDPLPTDVRTAGDLKKLLKRRPDLLPRSLEFYRAIVKRMGEQLTDEERKALAKGSEVT